MEIFSCYIVELAALSALISLFLDFCFREGNILGWWIDFLIDVELPHLTNSGIEREDKEKLVYSWWYKPLGGCVVCMNVWVSLSLCLFTFHDWRLVVVILLSSFLVRFFQDKIL